MQGVAFSISEKLDIAKALLSQLKVDRIEVASAGVSTGEHQAASKIAQWARQEGFLDCIEILGFTNKKKSVDWITSTGCKVINLLTKGSEKHCREQLGKTLKQHLADIASSVDYAHQQGLTINVYLEDWSNGHRDKPDYVYQLMEALQQMPIKRVMLPDTLGIMSPDETHVALSDMLNRFPEQNFDFHPHNDYGLAIANVIVAVKAGVSTIHCTVNCLGERAGNVSLAEVAVVLRDLLGIHLKIDESKILALSEMVANYSGKLVATNMPIVGEDVFTQTAGIHADGDNKGGLYKTKLSPKRFSRRRSYALGKLSGKASLEKNLQELGLELAADEKEKVLLRVIEMGDSKQRVTPDDLPFIIADIRESKQHEYIKLLECEVTSSLNQESKVQIKVDIEGTEYVASGTGNGGFNAFIGALDTILDKVSYQLPELLDYHVRIPKGGHTTALTECTITWDMGENQSVRTRGVHTNQVFASIVATLRLINTHFSSQQGSIG